MGVFGNLFGKNKNENITDENYLKTILESSKDEPLGVSKTNAIYAGYNELGGYYYLQTFILGDLKVKTKTGATLKIEGKDYNLELESDMPELESEAAHPLKAFVTKIDFEIEKEAVEKLKKSNMQQLILSVKNKEIVFTVYTKET